MKAIYIFSISVIVAVILICVLVLNNNGAKTSTFGTEAYVEQEFGLYRYSDGTYDVDTRVWTRYPMDIVYSETVFTNEAGLDSTRAAAMNRANEIRDKLNAVYASDRAKMK